MRLNRMAARQHMLSIRSWSRTGHCSDACITIMPLVLSPSLHKSPPAPRNPCCASQYTVIFLNTRYALASYNREGPVRTCKIQPLMLTQHNALHLPLKARPRNRESLSTEIISTANARKIRFASVMRNGSPRVTDQV